jgi:hypothetical protein
MFFTDCDRNFQQDVVKRSIAFRRSTLEIIGPRPMRV